MANEIVSGKLRIAASASFGAALLSQTLIEFRLQHPQVSVEVIFTETPLDLIEAGFDIAFYFTDTPPEGYVGHQLRTLHCKPIAHRSYLADKPNVSTPEELGDLEHILYKSRDLVLDKWTFTHKQTQQQCSIELESTLSFNLVQSMLDATLTGCGVAMLDEFALAKLDPAQKEQLVSLLPEWQTDAILPLYLLYPKREHLPRRTRAFIDHFRNIYSVGE